MYRNFVAEWCSQAIRYTGKYGVYKKGLQSFSIGIFSSSMQSNLGDRDDKSLLNDLKSLLDNSLFSDIKIKGKDGKEICAHRNILAVRSEVFNRMLLSEMKEAIQDVIDFPEFSSDILHIILEYIYTEKVTEKTLTIEIIVEAFHCADYFLLEQLKHKIIEFFTNYLNNNNLEDKMNTLAKILSRLLEYMGSSNNELANLLCDSINSVPLQSIEYCSFNIKALEYILSKIKREETKIFSTLEYDKLHYIILWAANEISEEALLFYKSCLPSSEIVEILNTTYMQEWNFNIPLDIQESHSKYKSTMITKMSSLLNYVTLERIHPLIISNTIEPLSGLINSNALSNIYKKQALLAGKYVYVGGVPFLQWDVACCGNMRLDRSPFIVTSNSISHKWIRTAIPISGQGLIEWDIVIEKICNCFWVGICTIKGFTVNYNSWLGKQAYGWVFGSNGVICHDTQRDDGPYTNIYGKNFYEKDRITVHLDMGERTCSFSINGIRYPVAFRNLPDEIYPAVSIRAPGIARIEPR